MTDMTFHGVPAEVAEQCKETLESITAVKGKDYASLVMMLLSMNSMSVVMAEVINMEHPLAAMGCSMLVHTQGLVMSLLQEKLGVDCEQKEIVDWADRINANMQTAMKAVRAPKGSEPPLH